MGQISRVDGWARSAKVDGATQKLAVARASKYLKVWRREAVGARGASWGGP